MERIVKKGSMTIEAACVMSVVLLVVMGTLQLGFYVHNRSWLTSAAYEAALSGSMEGVRKNGKILEMVEEKSREAQGTGFYGLTELQSNNRVGSAIEVSYTGNTARGYAGLQWELKVKGKSQLVRPVEWIRKAKAAAEIVGGD